MPIRIYDIDGTLTKVKGDNPKADSFETYAFWPLLSYHFAEDRAKLKAEADVWDQSDKGVGEAFIQSSQGMLQRGIRHFRPGIVGDHLQDYAREITLRFIQEDVTRLEGIEHLKLAIDAGDICILSTGSYQNGAQGFVAALIEAELLPQDALEKIVLSGAIIDWSTRQVTHANIADNKIKGLIKACEDKGHVFDVEDIVGIYVDDPLGNDSGLCALKPECVHLIRTVKNKSQNFPQFSHEDWSDIIAKERAYCFRPK